MGVEGGGGGGEIHDVPWAQSDTSWALHTIILDKTKTLSKTEQFSAHSHSAFPLNIAVHITVYWLQLVVF